MANESPSNETREPQGDSPADKSPRGWRPPVSTLLIVAIGVGLGMLLVQQLVDAGREVSYSTFAEAVEKENVKWIIVRGQILHGEFIDPPLAPRLDTATDDAEAGPREQLPERFIVQLGPSGLRESLEQKLLASNARVINEAPFDYQALLTLLWLGLLVAMGVMLWNFARRARDQVVGGGMLGGVTKSPAREYSGNEDTRKTFDDVAGLKGVKSDLKEIVEFLKEPEKFARLGARVPKGVLLNGPPGTGKTLLAKAVAGEAGVPFFSINGSEFIQLFVGVGASRVRDMFATAKKQSPAILFIDEIDAVGRQRGAGLGGGHDEREQTLNQILSEMDGFDPSETVIVMAATNRPDVLDPALLRPGRFDRHITVDRPTIEGREQLFEVHSRDVPIADSVDFAKLARATVGMTGADIMNLVNEAALWATRNDRQYVTTEDFEYARDKVLMGDAREDVLSEKEKQVTAFHEAGHALLGWFIPSGNRVHKVTIIPRGRALGVTQYIPEEDRHNISESELQAQLAMMLAGRSAEKLIFSELSAGAESDLKRATDQARKMVAHWGMSERIGPVAHHSGHDDPFLGREIVQEHRPYSESTAQIIDEEVSKTLHTAERLADQTLESRRDKLEALAMALLEREELDDDELVEILGPAVEREDSPLAPAAPQYITPDTPQPTARNRPS